jgi:hypothetical protein
MAVVRLQFTKMSVERKNIPSGNININNNITIIDVKEEKVGVGEQPLKVSFSFTSKFDPDFGSIDFEGFMIYMPENAKEILKSWKKDKSLPKEIRTELMNGALSKCNIEAILLAREVGLPSPIPLPTLEPKK